MTSPTGDVFLLVALLLSGCAAQVQQEPAGCSDAWSRCMGNGSATVTHWSTGGEETVECAVGSADTVACTWEER